VTAQRRVDREASDDLPLDDVLEVQGDAPPSEQDAVITPDEMEHARSATRTEFDRGEGSIGPASSDVTSLDGLALDDLREGETDDPDVAAEEGLPYVPPTAPPLAFDDDDDELAAESDLTAQIRDALRADAATSELADRLVIGTRGSTVVIRGVVDGIEDTDSIVEVVERVDGVRNVVDQTDVAGG
jgi:BON domain